MKRFLLAIATLVSLTLSLAAPGFAQQPTKKNEIPPAVLAAFKAKYPNAHEKNWTLSDGLFTAKAKEDRNTFYSTFDQTGKWKKTISNISWSWKLPLKVRQALKRSKYASWRVDKLTRIWLPAQEFYQIVVDNHYLQADADHAGFEQYLLLSLNLNGEFFDEKRIDSPLLN